jgi:hypothetical protein
MKVTQRQIDWLYSFEIPGTEKAVKALIKRGEFVLIENGGSRNEVKNTRV